MNKTELLFTIEPNLRGAYQYVVRMNASTPAYVCSFTNLPESTDAIVLGWYTTKAEADQVASQANKVPKQSIISLLIQITLKLCRQHTKHRQQ